MLHAIHRCERCESHTSCLTDVIGVRMCPVCQSLLDDWKAGLTKPSVRSWGYALADLMVVHGRVHLSALADRLRVKEGVARFEVANRLRSGDLMRWSADYVVVAPPVGRRAEATG